MNLEVNTITIDTLQNELIRYKNNILEILSNYNDFEDFDISILANTGFIYDGTKKGTFFIDKLRTHFNRTNIDYNTSLWIINKWGGIRSFKDNFINSERIRKLQNGLQKREFSKDSFSVISSLSKVASFINNEEFFVYDSKVIYTLNWLILKNKIPDAKYFPMPESRSNKLTLFDLDTIIALFNKDRSTDEVLKTSLFFDSKNAYFIYCDLIKELNKRLFPELKPYYLEMLLFSIADNTIFNDLRAKVNLTIK
jgi:hypothetical protein